MRLSWKALLAGLVLGGLVAVGIHAVSSISPAPAPPEAATPGPASAAAPPAAEALTPAEGFHLWLVENSDSRTGLPYSHVGDARFAGWTITYDAAVASMAHLASGDTARAKRVLDFYIETPVAWRLGGIIEAVDARRGVAGKDWSVRCGSNLWMGLSAVHLYRATREEKYLQLARRIADFALALEGPVDDPLKGGAIRLGPRGDTRFAGDQHLGHDKNAPAFFDIVSTEHNIDAYALFGFLHEETGEARYAEARARILGWLERVAWNREQGRFNRGALAGVDEAVATDIHSWGLSALGLETLERWRPGLADSMVRYVEKECENEVPFTRLDGAAMKVRGVDFVDRAAAAALGRPPVVSFEWSFQLANAYGRLERAWRKRGDAARAADYAARRAKLLEGLVAAASASGAGRALPYATEAEALIGHEYRTPAAGNASSISAAYGILALTGFDPLSE